MLKHIKRFLVLPVFSDDPEKTRLAYLLNVITLSSFVAAATYGFIAPPERILFAGLATGVTLISWMAMKGRFIREASIILVLGLFSVVAMAATVSGGVSAPEYGAFIVPILFSGLLFGWRTTVFVTLASIMFGGLLVYADRHSLLRQSPPYDLVTIWIIDSLYFTLAGVFVGLAIQLINQALRNVQRELGERKHAEERLLQFRKAMDESNDAIYIIDLETSRYLDFNRSAHESLGYTREELSLLGLMDIAQHVTSLDVWHERVKLVEEKGGLIFETVYHRKNGTTFPVEVSARMWEYEGNRVMIATTRDVSERKIAEGILQESDARLRMILESAIDGFISIDSNGDVLEWNAQAAQIFGWSREETVGHSLADLIIPESQREAHRQGMLRYLETGEGSYLNKRIEITARHRNGTMFPVELAIIVVPVKGRVTFGAFVRDITLKKQLEQERESLINELEARRSESETLRESLASIAGRLEFSEIIEDILDQVKRVVPYDTASVWRIDGQMQIYVTGRNVPPEVVEDRIAFIVSPENSAYPILTGEVPYILNSNVQEELDDFQVPPHTYVQSWLGIPLKTRGQILGLIALDGREKNQFTLRHAALATTFANQVAIALENSLLFSNLQAELTERKQAEINLRQRESILAAVAEAANLLLKTPDWKLEIDPILEKLGRTINASHAYLCENHLNTDSTPVSTMTFEWTAPGFRSDLGDPLYQNVLLREPDFESWFELMNSGLPYIGDERHLRREDMDYQLGRGMKSLLDVPIFVDGSWWGTIGFDDMVVAREWTGAEVDALLVAGNTLGAAIKRQQVEADLRLSEQNYRVLYETAEKQAQELALLGIVRNAIAQELDLPALLRSVVESIADSFGYALVSLYLIGDDALILQHQVGYERVIAKIPLSEGVAGRVASTGKPLLLDDVRTEPGFLRAMEGIVSEICVPLIDEGRVVGILNVESTQGVKLTETDMKLLVASSEHIGIAIGRARLYSNVQGELEARKKAEIEREKLIGELEVKNIESETLRESVAIVTATLEKEEAINRILEQLERVVPYDSASVQLINGDMLEIVSARWIPSGRDESDSRFEINEEEPAYPVLMGSAPYVLVEDIQLTSRAFTVSPHDRIHAWMAVPLKVKGLIIGIIALDGYRVGQFTERHARLAVTYASQVAAALENARLYSDLQADLVIRQNLISELESKNAELERFTYTVSHDLKSPLFTIRGFLGYLERDVLAGDMDRLNSDIQRIADATDKMQHLLNDLLELSRIGRLMSEPQRVQFDILVREVLELLHGQLHERGVRVVVHENLPDVIGDRQRLLEVLQNLIENAVKFMSDQNKPLIEIGTNGLDDHKPVFFVRDNGIGIPPEQFERIFGLFNKLDPHTSGTGIGLALVRRIIEFHGGRIWVESEAGSGSTFFFTLPSEPLNNSVI
ncbi:MAG TPA: GAF domain-containing protein [Anaerolineales bacterium]|nr:GAF domain-containing protein [Anaerolineales bacterium]